MTTPELPEATAEVQPGELVPLRSDATFWAKDVTRLRLGEVPAEAVNLNVTGKRVVGPVQGFGKLWQKTYRVELPGAPHTPAEVITAWKAAFASFWPDSGRFYGKLTGIDPGDVALLNLSAGGMKLSTGILVLYADDESFTFMTPRGTSSRAGSRSRPPRPTASPPPRPRSCCAPTTRSTSWPCRS
jgi:hypothetical protein